MFHLNFNSCDMGAAAFHCRPAPGVGLGLGPQRRRALTGCYFASGGSRPYLLGSPQITAAARTRGT